MENTNNEIDLDLESESATASGGNDRVTSLANTLIKVDQAEQLMDVSVKEKGTLQLPQEDRAPRGNLKLNSNNGVTHNYMTRANCQQQRDSTAEIYSEVQARNLKGVEAKYAFIKRQYNANKKQKNISKDTWDDLDLYLKDYCNRRSKRYGTDSMGKVYNVAWGLANGQSKCKSCTTKGIWKLHCQHMDYDLKTQAMHALNTAVNMWVLESDNGEMYGIKQNMEETEIDENLDQNTVNRNPNYETQRLDKDITMRKDQQDQALRMQQEARESQLEAQKHRENRSRIGFFESHFNAHPYSTHSQGEVNMVRNSTEIRNNSLSEKFRKNMDLDTEDEVFSPDEDNKENIDPEANMNILDDHKEKPWNQVVGNKTSRLPRPWKSGRNPVGMNKGPTNRYGVLSEDQFEEDEYQNPFEDDEDELGSEIMYGSDLPRRNRDNWSNVAVHGSYRRSHNNGYTQPRRIFGNETNEYRMEQNPNRNEETYRRQRRNGDALQQNIIKQMLFNCTRYEPYMEIEFYIQQMRSRADDVNGISEDERDELLLKALNYGLSSKALMKVSDYPNYNNCRTAGDREKILRKAFRKQTTETAVIQKLGNLKQARSESVDQFFNKCYKYAKRLGDIKIIDAQNKHKLSTRVRQEIKREVETEAYRSFSKGLKREIKNECFKPYQSDTRDPFKFLEIASMVEERIRAMKDDISDTEDENEEIQELEIDTRKKKFHKTKGFRKQNLHKDKMAKKSSKCYKCKEKGLIIEYFDCIFHNTRNREYVGEKARICYACRDEGKQSVFPCHAKHRNRENKGLLKKGAFKKSNPCRDCGEEFPCENKECDAYKRFMKNKEGRDEGAKNKKQQKYAKSRKATSSADSDTDSDSS